MASKEHPGRGGRVGSGGDRLGGGGDSQSGDFPEGKARGRWGFAARPSYRQIWMADGVSAAGPDIVAAAGG